MLNSKALKPYKSRWSIEADYENGDMSLSEKAVYLFKKYLVWPITDNYRFCKRRIKKCYDYAKFGYHSYDWDFHYVFQEMEFKLKRLRVALVNGHAIQEEEHMEALDQMIKAVRRLGRKTYENKYLYHHDEKWGKIESMTTPNHDEDGKVRTHTWHSWRKNTKNASDEVKEQEKKEFLECYQKGEVDRLKDIDLFADLLKKHSIYLWD